MRFASLVLGIAVVVGMAANTKGDDAWDYPSGRSGVNQVSAGRAGPWRVFDCETPDAVETVVLWYAKRLGLKDDHGLLVAASQGFASLGKDRHFHFGFGHDTDARKDHTQLVAHVTPEHAHVTFLHRPDLARPASVTISIAETATGTSVHVIEPAAAIDRTQRSSGREASND